MKWTLKILLIFWLIPSGCGLRERETALQNKETELARKEQTLLLQEKELQLKAEALAKKEQQLGQIRPDSVPSYNAAIVGRWNVSMVCTETTCPGSAVGDTKTEVWEISYQNGNVIAKAMSGENITRIYSGTYQNKLLELTQNVELSPTSPATNMVVRLTLVNPTTMEGQREIIRAGNCKTIFALQVNKPAIN